VNKLFHRVLVALCGVAGAAMGLALLLQERSLSHDLERAAEARLETAASAAGTLLDRHLAAMEARYRAISGTPQFRATLELGDAPTLAHYAGSLVLQHEAVRVVFLDASGQVVAGAGDPGVDAVAARAGKLGAAAYDGTALAVVSLPLDQVGRLLAVEAIQPDALAEWSQLCGAQVAFVPPDAPVVEGGLRRTARDLGELELRVTTALETERAAMAHARWNLALAAALGLGVAFGMGTMLSRGLVRPILELKTAAQRVGSGDLTVSLRSDRRDEIGEVAGAFEQMAHDLRHTLGEVAEAADRVDGTAARISAAAEHLSEVTAQQARGGEEAQATLERIATRVQGIATAAGRSAGTLDSAVAGSSSSFRELAVSGERLKADAERLREQTDDIGTAIHQVTERGSQVAGDAQQLLAAVEETAQSVGEMEASTRQVHAHAQETARLSDSVVKAADNGRQLVQQTLSGMEAIRASILEAQAVIRDLRKHGEQIGTILTVIGDVTGQTNLLALNASIIAAQAGEHGRSFAVVADEMKALAERVQASTHEIDDLVRAVQKGSAAAVSSIETGSEMVGEGVELARQAESSLEEITTAARESGGRMGESVTATAEQLRAASHVVSRMASLNEGAERIRQSTHEQEAGNASVQTSAAALRAVAHAVRDTIDAQAAGAARIGDSIETVRAAVQEITRGLEDQAAASTGAAAAVKRSREHTTSHEQSAAEMGQAASALAREADQLRQAIRRFRT
jgi:methyl-accepting chemotaxis protein